MQNLEFTSTTFLFFNFCNLIFRASLSVLTLVSSDFAFWISIKEVFLISSASAIFCPRSACFSSNLDFKASFARLTFLTYFSKSNRMFSFFLSSSVAFSNFYSNSFFSFSRVRLISSYFVNSYSWWSLISFVYPSSSIAL